MNYILFSFVLLMLTLIAWGVQAQPFFDPGNEVIIEDIRGTPQPPQEINPTAQEQSVMYGLIANTIDAMRRFVLEGLFDKFAVATKNIFRILVGIYLALTFIGFMKNRQLDIIRFFAIMVGLIFAYSVTYGEGNFERFIYKPVVMTTMKTANFTITASAGDAIPKYSQQNSLFNMLKYMEENVLNIMKIGERLTSKAESFSVTQFFSGIKYAALGLFVNFIYFALMLVFGIMYLLGIVALHFLLVFAPLAILIGAIPMSRGLLMNWGKSIATFALIPVFASIAMGATIFILQEVNIAVNAYLAAPPNMPIPKGLYTQIIMVGIFSFYFHLKAPEFASMLVGGPITNFGAVFAATVAAGTSAARYGALRGITPTVQKGGRAAKQIINRVRG